MRDVLFIIIVVLFIILIVIGLIAFVESTHCPKCGSENIFPLNAAIWTCGNCGYISTLCDFQSDSDQSR